MDTKQLPRVKNIPKPGEILEVDEAYPRKVPVPWLVLLPMLLLATLGKIPIMIIGALRGASFGLALGDQSLKQLREGPEVSVIPVWMRDTNDGIVEMEIHGYVRSDRIMVNDQVRVDLRPQRRRDLPHRAHRIYNLTTGQTILPRPNTMWSHLGLGLILQSIIGLIVAVLMIAAWIAGG